MQDKVETKRPAISKQSSMISEALSKVDLEDHTTCLLCTNQMRFHIVGVCNHKNVCVNCALRVRFLMDDKKCQICRTELDEVYISQDEAITWEVFDK